MGLFDVIFKKQPPESVKGAMQTFQALSAYMPTFTSWGGCLYESELVRASIDAIARNVGKLKFEIQGAAKPSMQTKLKKQPNEFQTWYQFMYKLTTILKVDNTAFIVPILDRFGDVQGIYPVLPQECKVLEYHGTRYLKYQFQTGRVAAMELDKCGIVTAFQYKREFFGETNQALNPTMELINIQNQGITEGVKNSATYRFMARLNNFSTDANLEKESERFSNLNFRTRKKGGLLLFPNTYGDIKQIDSKPFVVDAKQMQAIQTNVFNYFGVNEKVLQGQAKGDEWSAFYESTIEPIAIQVSEVLTKMLFTSYEQGHGARVMFTANRLQYMTNSDKLNVSAQMLDRGIMSRNEVRDIWNLPPVENGDGYIIRGEYYDADEHLDQSEEEPAEEPPEGEEEDEEGEEDAI